MRGGKAGRAGPHHSHRLVSGYSPQRLDPALTECPLNYFILQRADRNSLHVAAFRTAALARRGADPPRKLGKGIGPDQAQISLPPLSPVDQIIPLRDQVAHGAAGCHPAQHHAAVAKGDAAVHAPGRLPGDLFLLMRQADLIPILQSLRHGTLHRVRAGIFQKPGGFCHSLFTSLAGFIDQALTP
ncbi:hypothetical protein SDC9_171106 [bioreactor metagenome]|uniref:Uncharacterized protein n=1 Tax=bioreactor metagenome TaxID=1076179 RepID=A0A645GJ14_9ZZZZ